MLSTSRPTQSLLVPPLHHGSLDTVAPNLAGVSTRREKSLPSNNLPTKDTAKSSVTSPQHRLQATGVSPTVRLTRRIYHGSVLRSSLATV
jgi:hypothetical protein